LTRYHGTALTLAREARKEAVVSGAVLQLTEATFDEEIGASPVPVVVEFWAPWCPPCRAMAPILDSIALDYEDRVRVAKVDVDEQVALARRYDVASVPTVLLFAEGELRGRTVGARSRHQLLEDLGILVS
jgi:thioredoxin 1